MEIRPAEVGDAVTLSNLKRLCWEETYRGIYPDQKIDTYCQSENIDRFRLLIQDPDRHLFIAEADRCPIGYLEYGVPLRPFRNFHREIGLLYLLREFQHVGYGRQLFRYGRAAILSEGETEFFVSCNKYNLPARQFYQKMGGQLIHVDPDQEDRSLPQVKFLFSNDCK